MTTVDAEPPASSGPHRLQPGPLVLLRLEWSAGPEGCRLRVRRPGQASELVAAAGLDLRYRIDRDGPRHCVGHQSARRNDGAYLDCHNQPQPGERTCVSCAVADAEAAADLHHAHTRDPDRIHAAMLAHLRQPNLLYLAAFRDGSIKVGTSTARRLPVRLAEQGAWRASVTGTTDDGFVVRRLEDRVTEELGLPQSVGVARKLKGMTGPRPDADLEAALDELVPAVHGLAHGTSGWAAQHDRWRFPGGEDPLWARPLPYPGSLEQGVHHLRLEQVCGRLAVASRPGPDGLDERPAEAASERFVVDLGRLVGRELELGDFVPDALAVQTSLF